MRRWIGLAVAAGCLAGAATERSYTAAGTVADAITGDDSVTVNAACTYNQFVAFTGDNTYSGGTTLAKGNISVDHVNALGTGAIHCASGTTVRVTVSYRDAGTTLKAALLDRIVVDAPAGGGEPWVAVKLDGDGLRNDVDFTGQPRLWLCSSSPKSGAHSILNGIFTPADGVYRFGYSGNRPGTGYSGICVTNLTDDPETGAARSVLCRGLGATSFYYNPSQVPVSCVTYSGTFTAEDNAFVATFRNNAADFGVSTDATATNKLTFRNGAFWTHHTFSAVFPANYGVRVEGAVTWYHCGRSGTEVHSTIKGGFSGSGTLSVKDLGGVAFTGTNNTFTGKIAVDCGYAGALYVIIGDGEHFSWSDAVDIELKKDGRSLVLDTDRDVAFNLRLVGTAGSSVIKRGGGCVTLTSAISRTCANGDPVFRIVKGTVRRSVPETTPMSGPIVLENGATFDLGGVAAESCYLPVGTGALVHAPPGALVLAGTLGGTQSFTGTIDAAPAVTLDAGDTWLLKGDTTVAGPLAVSAGTVCLDGAVQVTGGVAVATGAMLQFGRTNATEALEADVFFSNSAFISGDTTRSLTDLFQAFLSNDKPDLVLDTTAFLESTNCGGCFQSYQFAKPADMTAKAYRATLPLEQMLGGVDLYEWFAIRFRGYFRAETAGTYAFRGKADDRLGLYLDGQNVFAANASYVDGTCELSAGIHVFDLVFIDMTCDEYFWFQMKAPGETTWRNVPLALLSGSRGLMTVGPVTGTGSLALAADGNWPAADFTGFTGRVVPNAATATDAAGAIALGTATLDFRQGWDNGGANWTVVTTGDGAYVTNLDGVVHYQLTKGAAKSGRGALNSTVKVSLDAPWSFSFDLMLAAPYNWAIGDGIFFGLQSDGPKAVPTGWDFGRSGTENGYGLQVYVMNGSVPIDWVNGNGRVRGDGIFGTPETNCTFMAGTNIRNGGYPLHCTLTWNRSPATGTNLVATIAGNGETWCTTNALAATQAPAKFPNGAYLTVRAVDGAYYCRKYVTNVVFDDGTTPETVVFDGTLGLAGGTVTAVGRPATNAVLAADLDVTGPATLAVDPAAPHVAFTSAAWRFASAADATLVFGAGIVLPDGPIEIACAAPAEGGRRLLADFTALGLADADYPAFVAAPGLKARLYRRGPRLYANFATGTCVLFR